MIKVFTIACGICVVMAASAQTARTTDATANETTVKSWVSKNASALGLSASDTKNYRISSYYYDKNAKAVMVYLQQTYKGVDVYNAITVASFKGGNVVTSRKGLLAGIEKQLSAKSQAPSVNAEQAVRKAGAEIKDLLADVTFSSAAKSADGQQVEFLRGALQSEKIIVRLAWVPTGEDAQTYTLGWQVSLKSDKANELWLIKIDATNGGVIGKTNLTTTCNFDAPDHAHTMECFAATEVDNVLEAEEALAGVNAKYKVIPYPFQDPNFTVPTVAANPWKIFGDVDAYTLKWNTDGLTTYDSTRGNNVYAQPDLDAKDNTYSGAAPATVVSPLTFNYTPNFNLDPLASLPTRNFAITNLFYWNNIMHDMSYQYGFDEVAGNFQQSNQGRGGAGNDYVIADAQDASGTNNANFSTPADGSSPRMQMYLWNASPFKSLKVNKPANVAGFKLASESAFSTANKIKDKGPITGTVVYYKDADPTLHLACLAPSNAAQLVGKIAYIDRGNCDFVTKVKNAQLAGAIAVIVGDNVVAQAPLVMGGTDNTITIPAFSILKSSADTMKMVLDANKVLTVTMQTGPQIDGDLDNGVVAHEYTHGISNRLTGGPANSSCLTSREPRAMGEGWSDFFGLMVTTNWAAATATDGFSKPRPIGNYAAGLTPAFGGIRYYPYSTDFNINPWTYDSLATSARITNWSILAPAPHTTGEVWCNMIWTMTWDLIAQEGISPVLADASISGGNSIALKLVLQGMKLQPCNPGFVDARNGILDADTLLFGGAYSDVIWKAFAKRGLGYSANENAVNNVKDGVAAYDLPPGVSFTSPVTTFTAVKQNTDAQLSWTSNDAIKGGKYVVEKSTDGINFLPIGSIAANDVSSKQVSFTDKNVAAGVSTYRIRSFNSQNANKLSVQRTVTFDGNKPFTIAPNPVRNYVTIRVANNQQPLVLNIYNSNGGVIKTINFSNVAVTVDVRTLPAGSYYAHVTGTGVNYKEKFIVE